MSLNLLNFASLFRHDEMENFRVFFFSRETLSMCFYSDAFQFTSSELKCKDLFPMTISNIHFISDAEFLEIVLFLIYCFQRQIRIDVSLINYLACTSNLLLGEYFEVKINAFAIKLVTLTIDLSKRGRQ